MFSYVLVRAWICCLFLLVAAPFPAMAQHGHELAADTCVLHVGPYKMYFHTYLPDMYYDRQFVRSFPLLGMRSWFWILWNMNSVLSRLR